MEKKKLNKRKKRIISIAVVATAFVLCIMATFGITMAYFGGTSGAKEGTLTLKSAVWVNGSALSSFTGYVLPSQTVSQACEVKVKSADTNTGTAVTGNGATKALLRATIAITGSEALSTLSNSVTSFEVKIGTATAYLVKDTTTNNYYLMGKDTIGASDEMYVIDTTSGEVTLTYTIKIVIPETIKNTDVSKGGTIKVTVQYSVIQADFYNTSTGAAIAKTVANAKTIFDATTSSAAY